MNAHRWRIADVLLFPLLVIGLSVLGASQAAAHCDGIDGPVVAAAKDALAKNDVDRVLIWVQKKDEPEIRRAFDQTETVRKLGPKARDLADTYFFETLVRIHRAGEGAPFTGLKPAGRDLGPAIPAADKALKADDVAPLTDLLVEKVRAGIQDRYQQVLAARSFKPHDVEAGRKYVAAYVRYIHYVEAIYEAAISPAAGHYPERASVPHNGGVT